MRPRPAAPADAAGIAAIYAAFVTGSAVSFETEAPGPDEMATRMASGGALYPWLVAEDEGGALLGYAYAAPFRTRRAYRFTVETTVYLRPGAEGQGTGRALYAPLLELLTAQGFTHAIAAIALPNDPSVRLHERVGFAAAGVYREVGWKLGEWWDVGLWQRKLATPSRPPDEPRPWTEFQSILT